MNLYTVIGHLYVESLTQAEVIDHLRKELDAVVKERDTLRGDVIRLVNTANAQEPTKED